MPRAAEIGAVMSPIVAAFCTRPRTLDDIIDHTVGRMLDHFDMDTGSLRRWLDEG